MTYPARGYTWTARPSIGFNPKRSLFDIRHCL